MIVLPNAIQILCVSQFTLYNVLKGNSPDFHHAMPATESKAFFDKFISSLKAAYEPDLIKGMRLFESNSSRYRRLKHG